MSINVQWIFRGPGRRVADAISAGNHKPFPQHWQTAFKRLIFSSEEHGHIHCHQRRNASQGEASLATDGLASHRSDRCVAINEALQQTEHPSAKRTALDEIIAEIHALPVLDARPPDEILLHDENGLPT